MLGGPAEVHVVLIFLVVSQVQETLPDADDFLERAVAIHVVVIAKVRVNLG